MVRELEAEIARYVDKRFVSVAKADGCRLSPDA